MSNIIRFGGSSEIESEVPEKISEIKRLDDVVPVSNSLQESEQALKWIP